MPELNAHITRDPTPLPKISPPLHHPRRTFLSSPLGDFWLLGICVVLAIFLFASSTAFAAVAPQSEQIATPPAPDLSSPGAQNTQQPASSSVAPDSPATRDADPMPQAPTPQAATPSPASGGIVRGTAKAGSVPLPGVSVTATNTLTGKRYATVTDATGGFGMSIPKNGRYVLRAELAAFAAETKEVLINATSAPQQVVDFAMTLQSRVVQPGEQQNGLTAGSRGTQALSILGANAGALAAALGGGNEGTSLPSINMDASSDSIAVSGSSTAANVGPTEDDIRQRIEDARANGGAGGGPPGQQGGGGGRGGGGGGDNLAFLFGGGGGGGGAFRRFNPTAMHGSLLYQAGNSALNARDFAVNGVPVEQPGYNSSRYGAVYTGPVVIPKLLKASPKNFLFLSLFGNHSTAPYDQYATVPTAAERPSATQPYADFSNGQPCNNLGTTPIIYNPQTGAPYPCNQIPVADISPAAIALLQYIPLPNQPGAQQRNFHELTTLGNHTDTVGVRFVRNFGTGGGGAMPLPAWMQSNPTNNGLRQNLNINFNYSHAASDRLNFFPDWGGRLQTHQYSGVLGYTIGISKWTNNLSANINRSDQETQNFFSHVSNPSGDAGIFVPDQTPFNYGLPNLQFSQLTGFNEVQPSSRINQVIQLGDNTSWIHGKHNVRLGGDFRRIELNVEGGTNSTGTFAFTGFATQNPAAPPTTGTNPGASTTQSGSSFADYLVGLPNLATVQTGSNRFYLRANVLDLFVQDNWRVAPSITLNYGLRYEYYSPYSEKQDRLANLDHNSDFTEVASVLPNQVGPYTGKFPRSLVNPSYGNYAPRLGIAWKALKNTVVRTGYGISYNTSQYGSFIQRLAYEPPFATTLNNTQENASAPSFDITNALAITPPNTITNNYAIDRNYRLGYVQVWNLDVQQTLPKGIVLNVGYNGSKGTHLDVLAAPTRLLNTTDTTAPGSQVFSYETSQAFSNFNALVIRARKRLQNGISLGATYTYSHSIDDASSIGGASSGLAQNYFDLVAEEGNSAFDIRHQLKGDYLYQLPFGRDHRFLNSGWRTHVFSGFQVSGDFTFATGTPLTPIYAAAAAEASGGTTGTLRPDRDFSQPLTQGGGSLDRWFNTNAFVAPESGGLVHYGNASRDSIPGPGTIGVDMALSRNVSITQTKTLEFRAQATNVFNIVQYATVDTSIGSPTEGQVLGAQQMRQILALVRYRF